MLAFAAASLYPVSMLCKDSCWDERPAGPLCIKRNEYIWEKKGIIAKCSAQNSTHTRSVLLTSLEKGTLYTKSSKTKAEHKTEGSVYL